MIESAVDNAPVLGQPPQLTRIATFRGIRVLAWDADLLYACRAYEIVSLKIRPNERQRIHRTPELKSVARFHPVWWRNLTARAPLTSRLVRDGFHTLALLNDERGPTMIGAVPGAIVTCLAGGTEFKITHQIRRGTRPLHITVSPGGRIYWGEYFNNPHRDEVHIYASEDRGQTWEVAHTFPAGSIRHVHNIVYDRWGDCLWILTGDEGAECKVLRASCDLRVIDEVLSGNQQTRSVAAVPMPDGLYLSTDTPLEKNHLLRLDRAGRATPIADIETSSIFGCRVADAIFFSTMVEPSTVNRNREVHLTGSRDRATWHVLARWQKDKLSMRHFQYGNAILPDGENSTNLLAATTIAVRQEDMVTTLWEVA
jgi:hypothetical protein